MGGLSGYVIIARMVALFVYINYYVRLDMQNKYMSCSYSSSYDNNKNNDIDDNKNDNNSYKYHDNETIIDNYNNNNNNEITYST